MQCLSSSTPTFFQFRIDGTSMEKEFREIDKLNVTKEY